MQHPPPHGGGSEAITPSRLEGFAGAANASCSSVHPAYGMKPVHSRRVACLLAAWASGRPSRVLLSPAAAGLIINVIDGDLKGESSYAKHVARQGQALLRMMAT